MKSTQSEKVIESFGSLQLTSKHIVQEASGFWRGGIEEIPLNKLDSIVYKYKRNLPLFVIGIFVVIVSLFLYNQDSSLFLILLIVGVVLIIVGLIRRQYAEFRAGTLKLSESGKGADAFTDSVRLELHNKDYV